AASTTPGLLEASRSSSAENSRRTSFENPAVSETAEASSDSSLSSSACEAADTSRPARRLWMPSKGRPGTGTHDSRSVKSERGHQLGGGGVGCRAHSVRRNQTKGTVHG